MPAVAAAAQAARTYRVHVDHDTPVHRVEAASFIDAAFLALERWSPVDAGGQDDDAVRAHVEDAETGERHCFTLHPHTGEADSCD